MDEWHDAGFAVMVEIQGKGKAGCLFLVYREREEYGWSRSKMDDVDAIPPMLRGLPGFTVAQVNETIEPTSTPAKDWPDIRDKMKLESNLTVEIVETGVNLTADAKGGLPIALFPFGETEEDMID